MATQQAQPAINTTVQMGDGASPENFTVISNQSSITGLGISAQVVDVTSHSTGTPWREKIPTLLDPGDVSFDVFLIPNSTGHKLLLSKLAARGQGTAGVPINFKLVFSDAGSTTWLFQGFITKFSQTAPVDNVLKASVTVTASGPPTFPA